MSSLELPEPDVLYHCQQVVAVNKPGGVLTQGPPGIDSIELRVKRWWQARWPLDATPGGTNEQYFGLVHRLDRPVSGVLLLGMDRQTTRALARQFQRRDVAKSYWAIVSGHVQPATGSWSDYMRKLPDEPRSEIVTADQAGAQLAQLRYEVVARTRELSLLQIRLLTGRTHQIRLQTSSRGHPVLGDDLYQSPVRFGPATSDLRQRWIALHARSIRFEHPSDHRSVELVAPLFGYWREFRELLESCE